MKSRHALLAAKLALSIGLVWYVATNFDLQQGLGQLRNLTAAWIALILFLYYAQLLVAALRFRQFLSVLGAPFGVGRAVDATLIGYFFSQTFISFIGGDAMRLLRANQSGVQLQTAAKAVVLDRASGFAGQVTLILLVLPFALPRIPSPEMQLSLVLLVIAAIAAGIGVIAVARLPGAWRRFKLIDAVSDIATRVLRRIADPRGFAAFFGYSLAINFLNIVLFFAISRGLEIDLSFADCLTLLPPVFFISMLPISVSGWGVREGAAIVALGIAGVAAADTLAVSVCFGLGLILISLPGGMLWLFARRKPMMTQEPGDAKS